MALVKEYEIVMKREEIREGIAKTVCLWHIGKVGMWEAGENSIIWEGPPKKDYFEAADMVMKDEDSQGVVIQVEEPFRIGTPINEYN